MADLKGFSVQLVAFKASQLFLLLSFFETFVAVKSHSCCKILLNFYKLFLFVF